MPGLDVPRQDSISTDSPPEEITTLSACTTLARIKGVGTQPEDSIARYVGQLVQGSTMLLLKGAVRSLERLRHLKQLKLAYRRPWQLSITVRNSA